MTKRSAAILIALAVAFLWSISWVLIKFGLEDIPALTFAGLRYSLACVVLLPAVLVAARRSGLRFPPRRSWPRLAGLGLLYYTATQGAMFVALSFLPAVSVNLLWSFSTIVVALFGIVWLAEHPTARQWLGIVIATAGAVLYFGPAGLRLDQPIGLIASAFGIIANAGAAILGRSVNRSAELHPLVVTTTSMGLGSLALLAAGILIQGFPPLGPTSWLIIGILALVNTALAFTLWNHTLRTLSATESSIINNTMLIWIPILAVLFLHERIAVSEIVALFVVAAGTLMVQLKSSPGRNRIARNARRRW